MKSKGFNEGLRALGHDGHLKHVLKQFVTNRLGGEKGPNKDVIPSLIAKPLSDERGDGFLISAGKYPARLEIISGPLPGRYEVRFADVSSKGVARVVEKSIQADVPLKKLDDALAAAWEIGIAEQGDAGAVETSTPHKPYSERKRRSFPDRAPDDKVD